MFPVCQWLKRAGGIYCWQLCWVSFVWNFYYVLGVCVVGIDIV